MTVECLGGERGAVLGKRGAGIRESLPGFAACQEPRSSGYHSSVGAASATTHRAQSRSSWKLPLPRALLPVATCPQPTPLFRAEFLFSPVTTALVETILAVFNSTQCTVFLLHIRGSCVGIAR